MLVSILTPTYNRRHFIPQYLKNIYRQDYLGEIEILIADDGNEPIQDLLNRDKRIKYYKFDDRKSLGFKRNFLAREAKGKILVNFDDDDYYPSDRISHAVGELLKSNKLIAGSSKIFVFNTQTKQISISGPFGLNHATAGTFAFKREYLNLCSFDENKFAQEEPSFTKSFTTPMVQLNPRSTILVIQHKFNTWDKSKTTMQETNLKIKDFIGDSESIRFYRNLNN